MITFLTFLTLFALFMLLFCAVTATVVVLVAFMWGNRELGGAPFHDWKWRLRIGFKVLGVYLLACAIGACLWAGVWMLLRDVVG